MLNSGRVMGRMDEMDGIDCLDQASRRALDFFPSLHLAIFGRPAKFQFLSSQLWGLLLTFQSTHFY